MEHDLGIYNLPKSWQLTFLGELLDRTGGSVQTGPFGSQLHASDYVDNGIPSVMPKNISVEKIDSSDIARVSQEDIKRLAKYQLAEGDIVYSRRGDVEKCALVGVRENGWLCGTGCLRVRLGEVCEISPVFLHAYLSSPAIREWISRNAIGATMPNLNTTILRDVPLLIPDQKTIKMIESCWENINKRLILSESQNQTLEQMAQALFKSWFVDFDPVVDNALAAGNPIPDELAYRVEVRKKAHALADFQPLPEHIRNLFPNEFEQTGEPTIGIDGWVPSGWDIRVVYDLGVFINGAAYKKFEPNKEKKGIPIIKIAELKNGLTDNTGYSEVQMPEKYLLKDKDILFSWSGNPDTSIDTFVWTLGEAWLNQHIFKVEPRTICNYEYLLSLLKYLKPVFSAIARDKQTTGLGHVTVKDLKGIKVALPSEKLLESFAGQAGSIFERSYLNLKQSTELSVLRDYLLPKLISGEIQLDSSTESSINQEAELQGV